MAVLSNVSSVRYIKLGPSGAWEGLCLAEGTLRLGHREVPHALAMFRDRGVIRAHLLARGIDSAAASDKAREIADFYDGDESVLWITFSRGMLWWCRAAGEVVGLDSDKGKGSRLRRALAPWSNRTLGGAPLPMHALSGRLTRTAGYRKTICSVEAAPYLIARLEDRVEPDVAAATAARSALVDALTSLVRRLTWQDFELLVDLVFAASGWRRTGAIGGAQKTVDIELELPSTGERAFVQVKSSTTAAEFERYRDELSARPEARMFYVFHTAAGAAPAEAPGITTIGPDRIAEMSLSAGLADWIIRKAS